VCDSLGKVSLVGSALCGHPELAERVPAILAGAGLGVAAWRACPMRASCLVPEEQLAEAVRLLHGAFLEDEA